MPLRAMASPLDDLDTTRSDDFHDTLENFLRETNSSTNTSHDSPRVGGVTHWREEFHMFVDLLFCNDNRRSIVIIAFRKQAAAKYEWSGKTK